MRAVKIKVKYVSTFYCRIKVLLFQVFHTKEYLISKYHKCLGGGIKIGATICENIYESHPHI